LQAASEEASAMRMSLERIVRSFFV